MTTKTNGWVGQTPGVTVTTANSATSGTALNSATVGSGALVYASTAMHGSVGVSITDAAVERCYIEWTGFASATMAAYIYLRFPVVPTIGQSVLMFRTSVGPTCNLNISSTGKLNLQDNAGAIIWTATNAIAANTWYRFELTCTSNASAGTLTGAYFVGDSATPVTGGSSGSMTGQATRGGNQTTTWVGKLTANTYLDTIQVGDWAAADGTLTIPALPAAAPVAAFVAGVTAAGPLVVAFNATTSTAVSPATVSSYAWNFGDSSTATGATPTHTYGATGTYNATLVVTDSNGVPSPTQTVAIDLAAASANGGAAPFLTAVGVTSTPAGAVPQTDVSDGLGTTFISIPSGTTQDIVLDPITYTAGQSVSVTLGFDRESLPTSGTVDVKLVDGATVRSTVAAMAVAIGAGSSVSASITAVFPATDCAAMTQWLVPILRLVPTGS